MLSLAELINKINLKSIMELILSYSLKTIAFLHKMAWKIIFIGFVTIILFLSIHFIIPNNELLASYIIGAIGITLAVYSEIRNREVSKQVYLIDKKVFGNLYSLSDTLVAIIGIISSINIKNNGKAHKRDNLFLMAYWLWFGMDDEWHTKDDIKTIKVSRVYTELKKRILNQERIKDSKTTIVVYDPEEEQYESIILSFIEGLIKNKSQELNIKFNKNEIESITKSIFLAYKVALNAIKSECENSHCSGDKIILCKKNIPNIIFAKEFDNEYYGISFLGEIDFLDFNVKEIKDKFFQKHYSTSSEFFGFQTHDLNMVKSLIKQVYLIKVRCNKL